MKGHDFVAHEILTRTEFKDQVKLLIFFKLTCCRVGAQFQFPNFLSLDLVEQLRAHTLLFVGRKRLGCLQVGSFCHADYLPMPI